MAIILEFKLPTKPQASPLINDAVISSTVDNMMLIIHHALHGTDVDCRPKDSQLAAQMLDELANHIKNSDEYDHVVLSKGVSNAIVARYPEMLNHPDTASST